MFYVGENELREGGWCKEGFWGEILQKTQRDKEILREKLPINKGVKTEEEL